MKVQSYKGAKGQRQEVYWPREGVSFEKQTQRFTVNICVNFKKIWLGRFKNEIEAARVRNRKVIEVYSEFASLNFSQERGSSE